MRSVVLRYEKQTQRTSLQRWLYNVLKESFTDVLHTTKLKRDKEKKTTIRSVEWWRARCFSSWHRCCHHTIYTFQLQVDLMCVHKKYGSYRMVFFHIRASAERDGGRKRKRETKWDRERAKDQSTWIFDATFVLPGRRSLCHTSSLHIKASILCLQQDKKALYRIIL